MQIKAAICNAVDNKIYENGGIFAPLTIENDCPLYFANDNCDFKINKSDGKIEFHGTITTVYQAAKKDCDTRSLKINLIEKDRSLKDAPLITTLQITAGSSSQVFFSFTGHLYIYG